MEKLYTEKYDDEIINRLPYYQNYSEMKPFIGKFWDSLSPKILLVGESHYLPKESNIVSNPETWYIGNSKNFTESEKFHISTRKIFEEADRGEIRKRGYSYFKNMKKAVKESNLSFKDNDLLFPYFSFYNYFLRVAEETGKSIKVKPKDEEVAMKTFIELYDILKPDKVIFVSRKANGIFKTAYAKREHKPFDTKYIRSVPHASASSYWNRISEKYENHTGRQWFIQLLNERVSI